jgi:hypothetical protein
MYSEVFFLAIVIAAWGIISYYFWFSWRKTKLLSFEESIRLDLKHSLPCAKLQLKKTVICLEQDKSIGELLENMQHPEKLGRRADDPKRGIGSVVIVAQKPQNNILMPQNIVGIVTLRDIAKGGYEQCYENKSLLNRKCTEIMSQDYIIANEETIEDDC